MHRFRLGRQNISTFNTVQVRVQVIHGGGGGGGLGGFH